MIPADRTDRINELFSQLKDELEALKSEVPGYAVEPCRFLRAEVGVMAKRLGNLRKVLGNGPSRDL